MSIADLFGSPSKTLLSQTSYSSGTGEFIREVTEQFSCFEDPYSTKIFTPGNIASEDEISFPFGSADSSRHSLLYLLSPTHHDNDETQAAVQSDNSMSSGSTGEVKGRERRVRRQRKIASFGEESTVGNEGASMLTTQLADEESCKMVEALSTSSVERQLKGEVCPGGDKDDSTDQVRKPQRRERRLAVALCVQNPLEIQKLNDNRSSPSEEKEGQDESMTEEAVTTPRQRKTYSMEDRLQLPLDFQLEHINNYGTSNKTADESELSILVSPSADTPQDPNQPASQPCFEFEDAFNSLDTYPNPPTSPRLPAATEGLFFEEERDVDTEGSSTSMDYLRQNQLESNRASTESAFGRGFGGKGGGVLEGVGGDSDPIGCLLKQYPHLSRYSASSLKAISHFALRKTSDSTVITRKDRTANSHRHRSYSDSAAPHFICDDDRSSDVGSHLDCDSGYNDEKSSRFHGSNNSAYIASPRVSLYSSDLLSQDEGTDGSYHSHSKPHRRLTPYTGHVREDVSVTSHDENPSQVSQSSTSGTMVRPRERSRRSLIKNFSQSSLGASSAGTGGSSETVSITSLFESQSPVTVEDILSNLGFDDFNSPQLIPDRFIPKEIEHAKPSLMRTMTLPEYTSYDSPSNSHYSSYEPSIASTSYSAPIPYSHHLLTHSQHYQSLSTASLPGNCTPSCAAADPAVDEAPPISHVITKEPCTSDLPLGATAENFLPPRSSSPPPLAQSSQQPTEREVQQRNSPNTNVMVVGFHRGRLETVPEETASDLSPSPRWLSPRVSIDHSVNFDVAEGKLGASLNVQKVRKRSLPTQREGYKLSVGSLVESDTGGDSIHFSVTSYDDEIAAEREKEREDTLPNLSLEDLSVPQQQHRRRRRGVYTPPPSLLSWLTQQKPIHEEDVADPDELPWPFNEQARLRKSLTEIQLAQMALDEFSDLANGSQGSGSGSSKADGCCSISSSPPSSIPRSSPSPGEDDTQEEGEEASSRSINNGTFPLRRRHSRDNSSTSSLPSSHKTRSLSCQSDYHILRKDLDILSNLGNVGSGGGVCGEDGLLRTEKIEELRYTMSATQRRLSRALALKGEQCRQLQEVANQT